jgi:hypothetical protein
MTRVFGFKAFIVVVLRLSGFKMVFGSMFSWGIFVGLLLIASGLSAPALHAQPAPSSGSLSTTVDPWRLSVTPYAWALGINGSLSYNDSRLGKVEMNPGNVLSNLNGAAMLVAQAHRGRLGFYLDAVYGDLTVENSRTVQQASLSGSTQIDMTILTVAPSYTLHQSPTLFLDGVVGARFLWQNASTTIRLAETGQSVTGRASVNLADAIVGFKGRYQLGSSGYFVPFYVDIGGGQSSSFTTQAYVGLGHTFDWGDLSLVAKNVYYQFTPNIRTVDLNLFGVAAAATFRF